MTPQVFRLSTSAIASVGPLVTTNGAAFNPGTAVTGTIFANGLAISLGAFSGTGSADGMFRFVSAATNQGNAGNWLFVPTNSASYVPRADGGIVYAAGIYDLNVGTNATFTGGLMNVGSATGSVASVLANVGVGSIANNAITNASIADGAITTAKATVIAGTVSDKTGYTASTVSDKTGYSLASTQSFDNTGQTTKLPANVLQINGATTGVAGLTNGANLANLDLAVSTRMVAGGSAMVGGYSLNPVTPTNLRNAIFTTTNQLAVVAGAVTVGGFTAGSLTAAAIASGALDGKGDWVQVIPATVTLDKTGATPTVISYSMAADGYIQNVGVEGVFTSGDSAGVKFLGFADTLTTITLAYQLSSAFVTGDTFDLWVLGGPKVDPATGVAILTTASYANLANLANADVATSTRMVAGGSAMVGGYSLSPVTPTNLRNALFASTNTLAVSVSNGVTVSGFGTNLTGGTNLATALGTLSVNASQIGGVAVQTLSSGGNTFLKTATYFFGSNAVSFTGTNTTPDVNASVNLSGATITASVDTAAIAAALLLTPSNKIGTDNLGNVTVRN